MSRRLSYLFLTLSLSSCAPSSHILTDVTHVYDTTYVTLHDTVCIVQVRDSMILRATEHITEQMTTFYDSATGVPVQTQVIRTTDRDMEALIRHLADSIYASLTARLSSSHDVSHDETEEDLQGKAAVSPILSFFQSVSSLLCAFLVCALMVSAIIFYNRKSEKR